jgi:hypothetical protein
LPKAQNNSLNQTKQATNTTDEENPIVNSNPNQSQNQVALQRIHIETGKEHRISFPEKRSGGGSSSHGSGEHAIPAVPEVSHLGWGHWYTLKELEVATDMFSDENVIGEGGYGIVYHGVLEDGTQVAVKNLLNNRLFAVVIRIGLSLL